MADPIPHDPQAPVMLAIRMQPPWVFIDELRRFVQSFCACACPGQGREEQVALAVHELMQNAAPRAGERSVELVLEVMPAEDLVRVSVSNPCDAEEYAVLAERLARMAAEPDALKFYVATMRETPTNTRGGLGLARVRFEAQLELSAAWVDGRVTVVAAGRLRAPAIVVPGVSHG